MQRRCLLLATPMLPLNGVLPDGRREAYSAAAAAGSGGLIAPNPSSLFETLFALSSDPLLALSARPASFLAGTEQLSDFGCCTSKTCTAIVARVVAARASFYRQCGPACCR